MYPMKPIFLGRLGVVELFGDVPGLLLQLVQRESWANLGAGPAICPILVRSKGPMFTMRPSWAHAAPGRVGSTRKNGEMLEIRRNKHETNQHQSGFFPPKDQKLWPHWSIHQNAEHTLAKLREPNPSQQKTRPPAPIIMNTATQRTSTRDPILNQVFENYWYMI